MDGNLTTPVEVPAVGLNKFYVESLLIQPQAKRVYIVIERGRLVDGVFQSGERDSLDLRDVDAVLDPETQEVITPAVTDYTDFMAPSFKRRVQETLAANGMI